MKLSNIIAGNLTILFVALQQNKPASEVRKAIQEALDAAWAEAWRPGNIHAQVRWQRRFSGARKPEVEEFIMSMLEEFKTQTAN